MPKSKFDQSEIFTLEGHQDTYQSVDFLITSVSSTEIQSKAGVSGAEPLFVLLYATQNCHIRVVPPGQVNPAATMLDTFLPANIQTHFLIPPKSIISAIHDTVDGTLHISPVS